MTGRSLFKGAWNAIVIIIMLSVLVAWMNELNRREAVAASTLSKAMVKVDREAWDKTLDTIENAYAKACNRAMLKWYAGEAGSLKGYTCKPVRGSVFIIRLGQTLGSEPVEFPWGRR